MSLNFEKRNALIRTRDFLRDLLDSSKTKRVPRSVREEARSCLKHYPWDTDIEKLSKKCPEILGTRFKDNFREEK